MSLIDNLDGLKLLKSSKLIGTQYVTKLSDNITIFIREEKTNIVKKLSIVKDKRSENKYIVKSENFAKCKFIADGEPHMVYFEPIIIAKIGSGAKSKENIYFTVDSDIYLYEEA